MEYIELADTAALRSNIYGFLSRGYLKELDREYLDAVMGIIPVLSMYAETAEDKMLDEGLKAMNGVLKNIEDYDAYVEEQALLYTRYFVNIIPNTENVYPYESVYLSDAKLVMQEQHDEVMEFYMKYSLGKSENFKEPEDHIAAELGFLYKLNSEIRADLRSSDMENAVRKIRGHKEFMEKHLLKWLHLFGTALRRADRNGFYAALADITMGFVRQDYLYICDMEKHLTQSDISELVSEK